MKKLNKKSTSKLATIERYGCSCGCGCFIFLFVNNSNSTYMSAKDPVTA